MRTTPPPTSRPATVLYFWLKSTLQFVELKKICFSQTLSFSDEEGALDEKLKMKKFIHPVHTISDLKDLEEKYLDTEDLTQDCEEKLKQVSLSFRVAPLNQYFLYLLQCMYL